MPPALDTLPANPAKAASGRHLIVELNAGTGLDDLQRIEAALRAAVRASGAELLHLHLHRFSPQGVTGVALLAESHITVHTWPEHGYGAFDVFMCGATRPDAVVPILAAAFETGDVEVRVLDRGPRRA